MEEDWARLVTFVGRELIEFIHKHYDMDLDDPERTMKTIAHRLIGMENAVQWAARKQLGLKGA